MNTAHVNPYLAAMDARQADGLAEHLSDEVVLLSPFVAEPFVGKDAVVNVLRLLLTNVDEFATTAVISGDQRAAVILRIRVGDVEVTGVDDMSINEEGLITRMSVQWRPLANIVAIQQKLAPVIGVAPLQLVPVSE
ncbi:hypothetical protein GOB93_00875 [Acetobacter musti]|uniref:SnoaL-like domain-containing protein n=1 Tax=Acetobacter musti TaxID=864732 RepID=A0ABX0JHM3_9PROT|nr:nuclear transport factor 2 family protein [Acetobacter musti]NHN83198.1 hypothetical protein [Acetobacter musti]